MIITYYTQKNYGIKCYYLIGKHAEAIKDITGKKTISIADMQNFKELGVIFKKYNHNKRNHTTSYCRNSCIRI